MVIQNSKFKIQNSKGFTYLELLITSAIIILLVSGIVLVINPLEQFAAARDDQREVHLNAIWNAVEEKRFNEGWDNCPDLPTEDFKPIGRGEGMYDLYSCLYPYGYLSNTLVDPKEGTKSGEDIRHKADNYWSFNDSLASKEGAEPVEDPVATILQGKGKYGGGAVAVEESTENLIENPTCSQYPF